MSPRAVVSLVLLACSLQGCALYAALDDSDAQDPDDSDLGVVDMPAGDMPGDMPSDMPSDMPGDMPPVDMPSDMPPVDMADMPPVDMQPDMMDMGAYDTLELCQMACRDVMRQCIFEEGKRYVCVPTAEAEQRCLTTAPLPTAQLGATPADFSPTSFVAAAHPAGALVLVSDASRVQLLQPATGLSVGVSHSELTGTLGDPIRAEALVTLPFTSAPRTLALGRPAQRNPEQGNLFGQQVEVTATEPRLRGDVKWSHSGQTSLCASFAPRILPYTNSAASVQEDATLLLGLFCNTSHASGARYELEGKLIDDFQLASAQTTISHEAKIDLTDMWPFPDLVQIRDMAVSGDRFYLLSVDERFGQDDPTLRLTPGEWRGSPMDPITLFASLDLSSAIHAPRADQGFGRDGCGGAESRLIYSALERGLLRLSADGRQAVFAAPFQLKPVGTELERLRRWAVFSLPLGSTNLAQDMRLRCVSEPARRDLREVMDMAMAPSGPLAAVLVQERSPEGKPTAVFVMPSSPGDNTALRLLVSRNVAADGQPPAAYYAQRLLPRPGGGYLVVGYQVTPTAASVFEMKLGADGAPICGPAPMMPN